MQINDLTSQLSQMSNRNEFVEFLDNNISDIETAFYKSDYDTINKAKFTLEDLVYDLESKTLIVQDEVESSIRAFIIILADFYDRFSLYGAIDTIFQFTPECSVKKRLTASKRFLGYRDLDLNPFNNDFDYILQLLEDAFIDNDLGYRAKITLMNYFLRAKDMLHDNYQDELSHLAQLFNTKKENYRILNDIAIQKLVNTGVLEGKEILKDKRDKLHKEEVDSSLSLKFPKLYRKEEVINKEVSDYASAYEQSGHKNLKTIQYLAKQFGVRNDNNYHRLERGTAIIDDESLLYQYVLSFGEMHKQKLIDSIGMIPWSELEGKTFDCIDWGCGLGFGTVALHDYFLQNDSNIHIENLLLIEPSIMALKRAVLHTDTLKYIKNVVTPVNKDLESLIHEDLLFGTSENRLQIFSNILDVPQFDIKTLARKIEKTQKGNNYFICISPSIDDLRNQRIESFYKYFSENHSTTLYADRHGNIKHWTRFEKVFLAVID
jgi:hypothetical protein